ncbi:O-antigen ligase family protein [Rathayibacter sp. YIM 133350]|uniref:O-antigen ligase family protein n=1 Tax=Rathayibacter sp. YIM 133350 TaxID=3131992 RepID=UPI00307F499E
MGARPSLLVRVTLFSIFFFPSSMIIKPIGAAATVPILLCCLLFLLWIASSVWGLHDPIPTRHPGRLAISAIVLASLASYAAMYIGFTGSTTDTSRAAGDRWLILLAASAALILVIAETARTASDVMMYVKALLAGGFFCCLVALAQFFLRINPMEWVQLGMPGFTYNGGDTPFQLRGNFIRVAGSTFHSIELSVVCAMLLPLSLWRALFDDRGRRWLHWAQAGLLLFGVACTVSRSGVLGLIVGTSVFLPFLPGPIRRKALMIIPVVVGFIFISVPGFIGTLGSAVTADSSDPSIATRLNNYPRVARLMDAHPVLGSGPGNYMPTNALEILDNQYLNTLVTLGTIGVFALGIYLLLPGIAGIHAARTARDPRLRALAGALAAGASVGGVCSLTFDSLSFPVFALVYPAIVGLAGAVWILVRAEEAGEPREPHEPHSLRERSSSRSGAIGGV